MKPFPPAAALALLLLLPSLSASTPLENFISGSFEPGSIVASSPLLCQGNYYLVSLGGNETYVVDGSSGKAVTDIAALDALLSEDARNRTGYASKVSSAAAFPSVVDAAKNASEAKCLQYIGDDGDPGCIDRQTCIVSCYSSPQCSLIIQADGFIDAVMDWDASRKAFSSALDAYSGGIGAVGSDPAAIDSKIGILQSLSLLAQNMSNNTIFLTKGDPGCSGANATRKCFEYCPKIDYSASRIASQAQDLALLKAALSTIAGQGPRAEAILNRTSANDAYLSSRGRDYAEFSMRMQNSIRNLKANSTALAKNVKDPSIAPMISALENISALSQNLSSQGKYRPALALRAQFDEVSSGAASAIASDAKRYSSLLLAMDGFSSKVQSSAWLIGKPSAGSYLSQLASLKANYSAPLTLSRISSASDALSEMGNALDAEISAKASSAGNSTSPPPPVGQPPAIPCLPSLIAVPLLLFAFACARRRV
ncbi:MAG: hypothetical protein WC861_00325 [Candidatus Micrarchaeia archaeon]|jgi:hypothetical protein